MDVKHSIGNISNNIVITMHGEKWILDLFGRSLRTLYKCLTTILYYWGTRCVVSEIAALMRTPDRGVRVLWMRWTNSHRLQKSCGEKGVSWPLSTWERAPTPAWTSFYCFSGHIKSRMVLIYYAQVRFRWLHFTENKGEDVANYIKEEEYLQMQRKKWLNWLHLSIGGLA